MESTLDDLPELKPVKAITTLTVLNNMINGDENVDLKSDISNPKALALLNIIGKLYAERGFDTPALYIEKFIEIFLRYNISRNRLSRKELTEVLSSQVALERQKDNQLTESKFK